MVDTKDAGRLGGLARAANLTSEERSAISRKAGRAGSSEAKREAGRKGGLARAAKMAAITTCRTCGEPEDGGEFDWFTIPHEDGRIETYCVRCDADPLKSKKAAKEGTEK